MKKVLIIGLGIGKLYKTVIQNNSNPDEYKILTIDIDLSKSPDYLDLEHCYTEHKFVDIAIICCPNYLHDSYITKLRTLNMCDTIVVEKPGLPTSSNWTLQRDLCFPIKLVMVKNNYYRTELLNEIHRTIYDNIHDIESVDIDWLNVDRIPNPGSWFTNKELAFGGVSRDLMPHLLSIFYGIFKKLPIPSSVSCDQLYTLDMISKSDYGTVIIENGVYNVDDTANAKFTPIVSGKSLPVTLSAAWKTELAAPKIGTTIHFKNGTNVFYEFGLCPENAYYKMILEYLNMESDIYKTHNYVDTWIHNIIDNYDSN